MNTRDVLLENKNFVTYTLAALVEVERDRILSNGLATKSQLSSLSDVTEYIVKMAKSKNTDVLVNSLANLCTLLKNIQLPGDFEKYTIGAHPEQLGEKFYVALDLPYEGEKFYDLSDLLKKKTVEKEKCPECEKEEIHADEDESDVEDCVEDCVEDYENSQRILVDAVNKCLKKIANLLGNKGDHKAAYLVERAIRSISKYAEI